MSYGSDEPKDFGTALNTNNTQPNTNWGKIRQINTFITSVEASSLPAFYKKQVYCTGKVFQGVSLLGYS